MALHEQLIEKLRLLSPDQQQALGDFLAKFSEPSSARRVNPNLGVGSEEAAERFNVTKWREAFMYNDASGQKGMLRELYEARRWHVITLADPEALARQVSSRAWPLCTAFEVRTHDYLFLQGDLEGENQATFMVVEPQKEWIKPHRVINTVQFKGFSVEEALELIRECLADKGDEIQFRGFFRLETARQHGHCPLCG